METRTAKHRGRQRLSTPDPRSPEQRRNDRNAKRRQRGIEAISNLEILPDLARLQLPAIESAFGVSTTTIWRRIRDGKLPALHEDGGIQYLTAGEVRRILSGGDK